MPASSDPELSLASVLAVDLLDGVPNVMFCIKDVDGRYVRVNQAFAERVGRRRSAQVVGKRAEDLFPADLAAGYVAQDRALLATGRPVRNQLERITRPDGSVGWYVTSKVLVRDDGGAAVGIASVSVDLRSALSAEGDFRGLATAIELIRERFDGALRVAELAAAAGMSESQLERRMRRLLGVSAKQLIVRTRVEQAAHLLVTTDLRVADVAVRCGFYDHSQLSRQFQSVIGVSPTAYRAGT